MWHLPGIFLAALALGACSQGVSKTACQQGNAPGSASCRINAEPYPRLLVAGAEAGAPVIGRVAAAINWRKGHLANKEDAKAYVLSRLRPLDLIVVNSNGKATHRILPGKFIHVAIYLGGEAELRKLGVWNDPAIQAHAKQIKAGALFIEADTPGVHLSKPDIVLNTDQVVILRPSIHSLKSKRTYLKHFYREIGTGFDFRFNADDDGRLFCAELASHVLANQRLPIRRVYGRISIVPDDILAEVLDGKSRLRFVAYVRGKPGSWSTLKKSDLKQDLFSQPKSVAGGTCS